jgi:branched-chain amino acid transport system substrate-binding protein
MKRMILILLVVSLWIAFPQFASILFAQSTKTVTLGLVGPWSGPIGGMGTAFKQGALIAKEFINADGGFVVAGQKYNLDFVEWDDRSEPKEAVAGFLKVIEGHKVKMIVGTLSSGCEIAAQSISEPRKVISMCTSASPDVFREGIKYTFRPISGVEERAKAYTSTYMRMGVKTVALATQNSQYCMSMRKFIKEVLARDFPGVTLLADEIYEPGTTDFLAMLTKMKAKNPDILYVAAQPADGGLICKQRLEIGWPVVVVGTNDLQASRDFFSVAGKGAEGVIEAAAGGPAIISDQTAKGMGINIPLRRRLEKACWEKYNQPVINVTGYYFDMVYMYRDAMVKTGTIEDTDKIREALLSVDYSGAQGRIRFDSRGRGKGIDTISRYYPDPKGMKSTDLVAVVPISNTQYEYTDINPLPTIKDLRAQYKY